MVRTQTALRQLPYEQQLSLLRERVAQQRGLAELLAETAVLSDHEPFAQLVLLLADVGLLQTLATPLRAALVVLPDTGVQRLLAALGQRSELAPRERQTLVAAIVATLEVLPLERVAAICLLDRWLKNEAPDAREALVARARREVQGAFEAAQVDPAVAALDDALLLRLPGRELRALTERLVDGAQQAWRERFPRFAARVLEVLETQPKSLSQANAEQLLARRVYTDPGHFLVELLQNADDARASAWHASIDHDRATVWHDGSPFDAKDVVGVLSIGQTTKARDQIGFFGVGFKAVYEICERPQVYSEPFCFEIADVSVPRRLAERPVRADEGGTLLVLPFRGGSDPARAGRLYQRARSLPPQTLLTLQSLRSWTVAHGDERWTARTTADGESRVRLHSELRRGGRDGAEVEAEVEVEQTSYLVASDRFQRDEAGQGTARAREATILVALALDAAGLPTPLPEGAPTIFAFLPTGERSGLRLLVHAPFQLPVDRERLDPTAPENAWALGRAAELLLRLVREQADAAAPQAKPAIALRALLTVLPRAEELNHPAYALLPRTLAEGGRDVAFLPAADGAAVAPGAAWLCRDEALVALLAGVVVQGRDGRLLAPLPARERALCLELGARPFAARELLHWLQAELGAREDGHVSVEPWLQPGTLMELWAALARLLGAHGTSPDEAAGDRATLAALPLLPDAAGRLHRAASVARAPVRLRALYAPVRVLLHRDFDPPPLASIEQLFVELQLPELGDDDLLADLADAERCAALLGGEGADTATRLAACQRLLDVLVTIPGPARRRAAAASAFVAADGSLRPLTGADALWLVADTALGRWLRAHAPQVPLVHEALASRHALLAELGASSFDLEQLLRALSDESVELSDEALWQLHELLAGEADELPPRWRQRLARAPIFFDRQGRRRVLVGEAPALLPADEALVALAPEAPWIAPRLLAFGFVQRLAPVLGAEALARRLLLEDVGTPLFDPFVETSEGERALRAAYDYLAAHAGDLPAALARRLAAAPLWLAEDGRRLELAQLRRRALPVFDLLYGAGAAVAGLADVAALRLATALGLEQLVAPVGPAQLVADLADGLGALDDALRPPLLAALATAAETLPGAALAPLLRLPLFVDEAGRRGTLARWTLGAQLSSEGGCCYRVAPRYRALLAAGSRPLLCAEDEAALAPLWARLALPAAGLDEALDALEHDDRLAAATTARQARALLVELAAEEAGSATLGQRREQLDVLALWPTEGGSLVPAVRLLRPAEATSALGEDWRELLDVGTPILASDAEPHADALAPYLTFRDPLDPLLDRLQTEARVDAPLSAQPVFLATRERLVELLALLARRGASVDELLSLPLFVDANAQLVIGPRFAASADQAALMAELPLAGRLLDRGWLQLARAALDGQLLAALCPPLPLRSWLSALADARREPMAQRAATSAPSLADAQQRQRLYRLLELDGPAIAADTQAAGLLGRAHVIPDREERLRAPRELLLVSAEHPELLALGGVPAAEVPPPLLRLFASIYQLEDRQQELALERLLPAHAEAVQRRDGATARRLLDAIAELLRADDLPSMQVALERLPTRFKLHRQLRIETADQRWLRPRSLLLASPERTQLLREVLAEPPPLPAPGHETPRVMALLGACGAAPRLDDEALDALLREVEEVARADAPGESEVDSGASRETRARYLDRTLALARYLALELADEPQLLHRLRLDRRAWLPDGRGVARIPRELYWPDARTRALVGDRPERFPHPELLFSAPVVLRERLPFRRPEEATIADIADELRRAPPASDELLRWLEDGLKQRRLDAAALREALQDLPCLRDDSWVLRAPAALCREGAQELFGDRGGDWSAARTYRRLSSALGIPSRPGPRQIVDVLGEIAEDLRQDGVATLLAEEPTLLDRLPRCLALLARRPPGALPSASAVPLVVLAPAEDGTDELTVVLADDARLWLEERDPPQADRLRPLWPDDEPRAARKLLRRLRGESPAERDGRQHLTRDVLPATESAPTLEVEESGLLARLGRWLRGKGRDEEPTPPPAAPREETRAERRRREREERERLRDLQRAVARREREEARERRRAAEREAEERATQREYREAERRRRERDDEPGDHRREPVPGAERARRRRSAPQADEAAPEERDWFRPREAINEQLGAHRGWIQDRSRAPSFGFSFAPRRLPAPWIYAPQIVSSVFDSAVQRWLPTDLDPTFFAGGPRDVGTVEVSGHVPVGHVLLPVPAFGRVVEVDCQDDARWLEGRGGRALLHTRSEQTVRYRVQLAEAPDFEAEGDGERASPALPPDDALLAPTVDAEELPLEVLELLVALREDRQRAPLSIALELRDMVRRRYRYDPSYLEDPQMARWLRSLAAGRPNMHIAALHAGRDARHLGRGVCYELNVLLCELLRRAGIPAVVASGWTFDRGTLAEPDHLWALALLPTPIGPRFCPLDASTTQSGRPLHAGERPPGPWRVGDGGRVPEEPRWQESQRQRGRGGARRRATGALEQTRPPTRELARVLTYLATRDGTPSGADEDALLRRCRALLDDRHFAETLRALLDEDDASR